MRFSKQVKKKNVFCSLESEDRDAAIREMVGRLAENGEIAEDLAQPLVDGLLARERLGSTGIGKGVAIPHVKHEGVKDLLIAVGRSDQGLDFAAIDGEGVRVLFLIIAPEANQEEYLEALRWVSKVARDDYHNKLLSGASTPAGFIELFQDIEESL
jgi:PTS system fructose-specific IIA component/PTS system nitrogen regulatory IIA component